MGGIGILFCIGLYLMVSIIAIVKVKPFWAKSLVLVAAILLPTADAVYGRYKLKQMCAEEGGTKIYRTVENVEGFITGVADGYYIKNYGYKFIEAEKANGLYYRVFEKDGDIVRVDNVSAISKYYVRSLIDEVDYKRKYRFATYQIETYPRREILAKETNIYFVGGWAEHFLGSFADAGAGTVASCDKVTLNKRKLILSILKP